VSAIYSLLKRETLSDELVEKLCLFNLILMDNKFVNPTKLQREKLNTNLKPLLFRLPLAFATKYLKLTERLLIPLLFTYDILITALNDIKKSVNISLSETAINNAIAILEIIANKAEEVDAEMLSIPTTKNRFNVAVNLYYINSTTPQKHLTKYYTRHIHKKLIFDVAQKFGVRSLVAHIINKAECKFMGEDFGQKERLIDRIKGILKKYPHELANLFLKMLQNANDAGATKLHIIYDTTKYKTKNLLDRQMASFQDPSLLIYNNAVFEEEDF
jgi:sacsin